MNIAFLVYDISLTGGAEHVAINMANELKKIHKVNMISVFNSNNKTIEGIGNYVISDKVRSMSLNLFKYSKRIRRIVLDEDIDILISITAGVVGIASLAVWNTNAKMIYAEHSNLENKTYGKKHELRQFIGAKKADCVVTLTDRDKYNFIKQYNLIEKKVRCIPNWLNTDLIDCNYKSDTKKIISAGRLEYVKGYDLLLKVASSMMQSSKDWTWDIYGEGSLKEELIFRVHELGLDNNVFFKGKVNDIQTIYNNYSLFVMTSYYEGLPLVLLEAQCSKLPIVSFDCPTGPAEIVTTDVNGKIIPAYDIESMSSTILDLIDNEELLKEYSFNAQKDLYRYDKTVVLKQWLQLFDELRRK